MERYLRKIALPSLTDSSAWLKFINSLWIVLLEQSSHTKLGITEQQVKDNSEILLRSGALPVIQETEVVTNFQHFPLTFTGSPESVFRAADNAGITDFNIEYRYEDGLADKPGARVNILTDIVTLSDYNDPYYRYTSKVKDLTPNETHIIVGENLYLITGVNTEFLTIDSPAPLELATYGISRKTRILTNYNNEELKSVLAIKGDSDPSILIDYLFRILPARCIGIISLLNTVDATGVITLSDILTLNYSCWVRTGVFVSSVFTEQQTFFLPFYANASTTFTRRFVTGTRTEFIVPTNDCDLLIEPNGSELEDEITYLATVETSNLDPYNTVTVPCILRFYKVNGTIEDYPVTFIIAEYSTSTSFVNLEESAPSLHDNTDA